MKKYVSILLVVLLSLSMSFVGISCKEEAAEETTEEAAEETTEEAAPSEEEESVVAEEKPLYVMAVPWWGYDWADEYRRGMEIVNSTMDVEIIHKGDDAGDYENDLIEIKQGMAMGATGIFIQAGNNPNVGPTMEEYYNSGGIIILLNGTQTNDWPHNTSVGTDNFYYGYKQAIELGKVLGGKGKIGIISVTDMSTHISRTEGVKAGMAENYPDIEVIGPVMEEAGGIPACAQNISAFIAANEGINGLIATGSLGGSAYISVAKELGLEGISVICGDTGGEILDGVEQGYLYATLAQGFVSEVIYSVIAAENIRNETYNISTDDDAWGFDNSPKSISTALPLVTKDNLEYFRK